MRLGCKNALSLQIGVSAANWHRLRIGFGLKIGVWAVNWRLGCNLASAANWRLDCKLAFELQLEFWLQNGVQICSRTGHSYFPAPQIICFPDNRPSGFCGAATRFRPCEQALWTLQSRASRASLAAGPAVFAGSIYRIQAFGQLKCVLAAKML